MSGQMTWMERCQLWLPMQARDHDPVLTKTLNRGRAGSTLDGVFGAGAAEPTKLDCRRGYYWDGADTMQCTAGWANTEGLLIVCATFAGLVDGVSDCLAEWGQSAAPVFLLQSNATNLELYIGGLLANNAAHIPRAIYPMNPGQLCTVLGTYDGTDTRVWFDGEWVADAVTPQPPVSSSEALTLGVRTDLASNSYTGSLYHFGVGCFAAGTVEGPAYDRWARENFMQE